MNLHLMWQGIAEAALNYIVVQTITNINSQKTVSDIKTDLRTTKEDIMSEMKTMEDQMMSQIKEGSNSKN